MNILLLKEPCLLIQISFRKQAGEKDATHKKTVIQITLL